MDPCGDRWIQVSEEIGRNTTGIKTRTHGIGACDQHGDGRLSRASRQGPASPAVEHGVDVGVVGLEAEKGQHACTHTSLSAKPPDLEEMAAGPVLRASRHGGALRGALRVLVGTGRQMAADSGRSGAGDAQRREVAAAGDGLQGGAARARRSPNQGRGAEHGRRAGLQEPSRGAGTVCGAAASNARSRGGVRACRRQRARRRSGAVCSGGARGGGAAAGRGTAGLIASGGSGAGHSRRRSSSGARAYGSHRGRRHARPQGRRARLQASAPRPPSMGGTQGGRRQAREAARGARAGRQRRRS
ncbi:hypothetical protein BRADI_3g44891v3 [Brachypodium distachyon]|uniref:Uncharacterized protein n=1 Tax=Brachypodium distachyon TaxID=15368 RepID=A0A2K2D3A4_BRADI|nr:hypothetical protein BRADI_3g44891v3 [Brachypodium distachyon]